jgi:DNA invertase Pin-like site-specific DNA recombinase
MAKSSKLLQLGWARVSTDKKEDRKEQTLDQQIEAIQTYGVLAGNIYDDKISGTVSLKKSEKWAALSERALDPKQPVEIALVSWSRLSRNFYDFLAAVNLYTSNGCVFTIVGDARYQKYAPKDAMESFQLAMEAFSAQSYREGVSKATKAALHYKKHVLGIKLGRPEKLTLEDCAEIDRLAKLDGYENPRLIAEEITSQRLASIPEGLEGPEREKAERHATVSRPIIYRYLALTGLAESDFNLIDVLKDQHGDDCEAIAKDLTAARIAAIPEDVADDEEANPKALKAATVLRSSIYRYLRGRAG